jgi:HSP20 family protein
VDIVESDNEIVLKADLPGLDPKDVEIHVQNGTLTLKGERKFTSDVKEDDCRRAERVYGSFLRSFSLPQTVDPDKVEADYGNGVLEVRLPKRPEAKPKQIKVAVKS